MPRSLKPHDDTMMAVEALLYVILRQSEPGGDTLPFAQLADEMNQQDIGRDADAPRWSTEEILQLSEQANALTAVLRRVLAQSGAR